MTTPNIPLTWVKLIAGPDTQPEHAALVGRYVAVPTGTDIGSGPTNQGTINGITGYPIALTPPDPVATLGWVLSTPLPLVAKTFISAIPDEGWASVEFENAYRSMALALLDRGIGMEDIGTLINTLHDAAVENERAHTP